MENENTFQTAVISYIVLFLTNITYIKFIWSQKANLCVKKENSPMDVFTCQTKAIERIHFLVVCLDMLIRNHSN